MVDTMLPVFEGLKPDSGVKPIMPQMTGVPLSQGISVQKTGVSIHKTGSSSLRSTYSSLMNSTAAFDNIVLAPEEIERSKAAFNSCSPSEGFVAGLISLNYLED